MRRSLAEMLVDIMSIAEPIETADGLLIPTSVHYELPIETMLKTVGQDVELLGDLPRWRWTTVFDQRPTHLSLTVVPGENR